MAKQEIVNVDVLGRGAEAAMRNASRLIGDAQTLLDSGSAPTAHSLSILAFEETAKALRWFRLINQGSEQVVLGSDNHILKLSEVWETFGKLDSMFQLMEDPDFELPNADELKEKLDRAVKESNSTKQRGFYVDVEGQQVLEPNLITHDQADEAIRLARLYLNMVIELGVSAADWEVDPSSE